MTTVLHVPFTYAPDPMGGTEVYVAALAAALEGVSIGSVIAAPSSAPARYRHGGFEVHRFAVKAGTGRAEAQGEPDEVAAGNFATIVEAVRPEVVHLHAHTSAVSELLLDVAREAGAATVVTYHTPTFSCMRGTLLYLGREVCDGVVRPRRCAACTLAAHGLPEMAAHLVAMVPPAIGREVSRGGGGRWRTALGMRAATDAGAARFRRLTDKADRVVAPAAWVVDVLRRNGVPAARTALVRQGLPGLEASGEGRAKHDARGSALRLGFFGRASPTKGIDTLTAALSLIPEADVTLDLTLVHASGDRQAENLQRAVAADPRIRVTDALPPEGVVDAMRALDLVVIPSRWLETGPLVALEAFAAGTPVLGSRLGGIAELVRDGVDGILLPPDDPPAWASMVASLANDRARLSALAAGVRPPRTMADVAGEMAAIYRAVAA